MCECPIVRGVKFVGDGYTHCEGKESYIVSHPYIFSLYNQSLSSC